jgi:16S rRNA (adenine1518-N6/adenine1519-N6)-dimethyltransferase
LGERCSPFLLGELLKAIKELGQHFLNDQSIASDIADLGEIEPGERVWEIGPGPGILTREILNRKAKLEAFELDRRMINLLQDKFSEDASLLHIDILRLDWDTQISAGDSRIKIVANIPYQITSPLLYKIQQYHLHFPHVVMMVQKEVAARLSALPGSKDFGPLTLKLGMCYKIRTAFMVSRNSFDPAPKVDSAVIVMQQRIDKPVLQSPDFFVKILNASFAHRRKTLRNNLLPLLGKIKVQELEELSEINFGRRAETLDEKEFIRLSDLAARL